MCLNPITRRYSPAFGEIMSLEVPCGKCLECLKKYQNDWTIRMYEEILYRKKCSFLTFTYREKITWKDRRLKYPYSTFNIPPQKIVPMLVDIKTGDVHRTVYKKHIQDAFKRFREYRKKKGLTTPFTYFVTSEYGPRTLRPHYHILVFGLDLQELLPLRQDWQYRYGYTKDSNVTFGQKSAFNTAKYVAKYCSKGVFENPKVKQGKVFKTFHLISKKLGYHYVDLHKQRHLGLQHFKNMYSRKSISYIVDNMFYSIVGSQGVSPTSSTIRYSLPKYYKEYIYGKKNLLRYKMLLEILQRNDCLYRDELRQIQSKWNCSELQAFNFMVRQKEDDKIFKEKELFERLAKHYDKSKN